MVLLRPCLKITSDKLDHRTVDGRGAWICRDSMQTTVATKNMVTIPAELSRRMRITPGCRLEWREPEAGSDEVTVRVIPTRGELARRLKGRWKAMASGRDVIA
jgi:bifunctional DNA-binding transcriptional regulator/antitoxin component of YhaV-PrlF toxin-antitoxin module